MIIGKTKDGQYLTNHGLKIPSKEYYLDFKKQIQEIKEPTEKELIELGKQHHPFFKKDLDLLNVDNQIDEISLYELKKDKIIID
jgi:hypothetical protein